MRRHPKEKRLIQTRTIFGIGIGAYICCGRGDLLHKTEPDHVLIYDMVKVKVVK